MKYTPDLQCRRCGHMHDDSWQLIDPEGFWAVATVQCHCGHVWSVIHAAPVNIHRVRLWVARGGDVADSPIVTVTAAGWQESRLEGVCPKTISVAS